MTNILKFPDNRANNTVIVDADYFGYSETIPLVELIRLLQKSNGEEIKDGVDNSENK